jgi:uncharacterized protein YidB (DUF937 family)
MTRKVVVVLVVGVVAALLLAAVGGAAVLAQTGTPPSTQSPQTTPQTPKPNLGQDFWQALADKLGVSIDVLRQDIRDALKSAADKAVQEGNLSQAQADQLKQRADQWQGNEAPFPFFGRPGFEGHGFRGRGGFAPEAHGALGTMRQDMVDAAAKALNMNTQDLTTELRSGKSLADIAKDKGVDEATLKKAMVDAGKADVDKALSDGQLTQQQADQMKSQVEQLDLSGRMGHGWGPGRGKWFGAPTSPRPQVTPGSTTL